jgi:predicted Zn-dependent protease
LCALAIGGAACARHRYLGSPVPPPCHTRDVEGCLGWMLERDLSAVELGVYADPALHAYVQGVADRLARNSDLAPAPRVWIADDHETYATAGRRIVVARAVLERVGSEAELAAVLAHELAHLEARHVTVSLFPASASAAALADRRDAEAIADERAVWLLERAGYAPGALARALDAILDEADAEHAPRAARVARAAALAEGRVGFEGRAELLRAVRGMVLGRDPRLGHLVDDAWVVPALGIALELTRADRVLSAGEVLALHRADARVVAYAIGAPWASELRAALEESVTAATSLGRVTVGVAPLSARRGDPRSPLARLVAAVRGTRPQPPDGARVAILERPAGALVVELGDAPAAALPRIPLRELRAAEALRTQPRRVAIVRAARTGTLRDLGICGDRLLDDPRRRVSAGDAVKCADRSPRDSPLLGGGER